MPEISALSFPPYNHSLLEPDNVRFVCRVYRQIMKDTFESETEDASLKERGDCIAEQIRRLNNAYVWYYVLRRSYGISNREEILGVSQVNESSVNQIARVLPPAIILGHDTFEPILAKYPATPINTATLVAIEKFPALIHDDAELTDRMASVLGTEEQPGTFGSALAALDEEVMAAQPAFIDMLRVYGSYYVSRHPL